MEEDDEGDIQDIFGSALAIGSGTTEAERDFATVLEQIRDADGMKYWADVYTKLYDSYNKAKEDMAVLQTEMDTIKAKMERFDDTISEYQGDLSEANKTIDVLRHELGEAKNLCDAMHARELASVDSMETMKKTLYRLEKELDARKRAGDDEGGGSSVAKEKEKFEKEKARLESDLEAMRSRLNNAVSYQEELVLKNQTAEDTIAKMEEQIEELENNAVRNGRLVDYLKEEAHGLKASLEERGGQIASLTDKYAKLERQHERRDKQLQETTGKLEAALVREEEAQNKAKDFRSRWENTTAALDKLKQTHNDTAKELKLTIDDNKKIRTQMCNANKNYVNMTKKFTLLEQAKAGSDAERDRLHQQVAVMEREIVSNKREAEGYRRDIENLGREKEIMSRTIQKIQTEAQENLAMITMQESRRQQLEHEIELNTQQINKQRLLVRQYEKEKDRMLEEEAALNEKIDETMEEVRVRTADLIDVKKELREEAVNSRKLSVALDTCRTERNMLHKNYTEALDEIQDLKNKLRMLAYQIEQSKEDVTAKEAKVKKLDGMLFKANKKMDLLRTDLQLHQTKLSEARGEIAAMRQEEAKLYRIIHEGDTARGKLLKELEGLVNERDVVGAQLVRRNDELSLLYEKIRILEVTLHRGERQYEQRVEDIRLLRLEVIRLRKEKNLLAKGIENMTDLRLEVFNLERELGRSRLRVRALEEALETPLNVHRWRKLQGSDPDTVTLMQKLRITQKKVLRQSEMLVLKDREMKETKNLYEAVKEMLALQPSPEIQQTLSRTQRALSNKTSKMKCVVAELNMREKQVADLRLELDRCKEELQSYKQRYYEIKRALDVDEARRLKIMSPGVPMVPLLGVRCRCDQEPIKEVAVN